MKVVKEIEIKYVVTLSEMELATLSTVLRKANAEFIQRNSEGEGFSNYENMLESIKNAIKEPQSIKTLTSLNNKLTSPHQLWE